VTDSLPAVLFHHAAERPEEPWLFYRQAWDWHWVSFRAVAEQVAVWISSLAALPAGSRAAFAATPSPPAIALDLALQGAGLTSMPLPEGALPGGAQIWIEPAGSGGRWIPDLPRYEIPVWREDGAQRRGTAGPVIAPPLQPGRVVIEGGGELTAADLVAAAEEIEALLPAGRRGREILASCRPLSDPVERRLLAWATWSGAALLLEPERAAGAATAVWARPTLFHGDAAELAVLRRAVERRRFFLPRLPFGRLHTILLRGDLPDAEREFWEERGVWVVVPHCGAEPPAVV
jgi:hypothetical protein